MPGQEEPLISDGAPNSSDPRTSEYGTDGVELNVSPPAGPPGLFIWLLTFSAGISGLLFGCEELPFAWVPWLIQATATDLACI